MSALSWLAEHPALLTPLVMALLGVLLRARRVRPVVRAAERFESDLSGDLVAYSVSESCTTGWASWGHGVLLASPTHLVRLESGVLSAIGLYAGNQIGLHPVGLSFGDVVARSRVERGTFLVPLDEVVSARFLGVVTPRLRLVLSDGTRRTLMWMPADPASRVLPSLLSLVLGERYRGRVPALRPGEAEVVARLTQPSWLAASDGTPRDLFGSGD